MINKKIINIRKSLDKLDDQFLRLIKKRTSLVNEIVKNKKFKKDIVDKKRINIILKNIKKKNKRILVGADAHAYDLIQRLFPKWYIYLLPFVFLIRRLFPMDKPLDR